MFFTSITSICLTLIILGIGLILSILAKKYPEFFKKHIEDWEKSIAKFREDWEKRKAQKKETKAKHPWFYMFKNLMIFILVVGLVFGLPVFAYKKIALDYTGTYAKDRFIYDSDEGLCMLVTYYPEYRTGEEKGFALAHLPVTALGFPLKSGIDKRKGNDIADSKEILDSFQTKSTWGGSGLLSILSQLLGAESGSSNSFDIGKHGKYFIIDGRNLDYEKLSNLFDESDKSHFLNNQFY